MNRFEYQIIYSEIKLSVNELDIQGLRGWELCSYNSNSFDYTYFFKRELK